MRRYEKSAAKSTSHRNFYKIYPNNALFSSLKALHTSHFTDFALSKYPCYHFGVIDRNISKLIPGIGRARTERYSSLKRLLIVPLSDRSAHLNERLFSRERLFIKYGGRVPERVMSLLDIVYRVL
jgi:hypothetical protein